MGGKEGRKRGKEEEGKEKEKTRKEKGEEEEFFATTYINC